MTRFEFLSAVDTIGALQRGDVSSRELLDLLLARIERHNPSLRAIATVDEEHAREAAQVADDNRARGETLGPLHGLPVSVKDSIETAGLKTTSGSPSLADYVPEFDAPSVRRLREAGAIVFAKSNLPEYASDLQSFNDLFGCATNPWDEARSPGGSSGGSAAALAAGLTSLELGSDIGGSIRMPAHYCGVYGLKPTYGIVPLRGHIPRHPGMLSVLDLAVIGPMGRSADDLDLALGLLAGPDGDDAAGWQLALPAPRFSRLEDCRVAAWLDDSFCTVDNEVLDVLRGLIEGLRGAGVDVVEIDPPVDLAASHRTYMSLFMATASDLGDGEEYEAMVAAARELDPSDHSIEAVVLGGITQSARSRNEADEARQQFRARWAHFFESFDVLLCPVAPTAALPHDHTEMTERTFMVNGESRPAMDQLVWGGLVNMPYLPAVSAPAGRTPAGLPVGVQVVAPYLHDRTAIAFARSMAEVVGAFQPPPRFHA